MRIATTGTCDPNRPTAATTVGGALIVWNWGALRPSGRKTNGIAEAAGSGRLHTIRVPGASVGAQDSITIRLADCAGQRSRANMLLSRMYASRGYGRDHKLPSAPNCVTFTATANEDVIGTLTLTVDSSAGLATDRTYKQELDRFRGAPGARICELTRFAFDTSSPARPRLAALFHIIFIYGSMHYDCTDLFIEVHPKHRRFYELMLGFTPLGEPKFNADVRTTGQLMWLNVGNIRRLIDAHHGAGHEGSRSLYKHFFSAAEEQHIRGRVAAMTDAPARIPRPLSWSPPRKANQLESIQAA